MSTDQNLEVLINANAAGVKAGMAEAQQSVQQAGQHMAESLKKVEDETKNTVQGMMDLFKRLVTGTAEAHGAAAASAQAATGAMEAGIKSSVTGAQAALSSLGGAFSFVGANLGLLAGVAAGGMAFKEAINATNDWNSSALKLAKQLGITTEEASVQLVALHKLGIEGDVLGGAVQKVSMQLMKGGEAFETMGIKTKDATGQFRPAMEIISETNEKIKEIQNPILQTQAGLAAYGRAWADIRPLMKLTAEGMDEARIKADQLGLVVNSEQAAKTREYKEAMREFGLATEALGINVGRAVLPFFTDLVSVLARVATTVVTAMRPAFDLLSFGFKQVNELVHGAIDVLVEAGHVIADVFGEVAHEVFGESVPRDLEIMVSIFNVVKTLFVGFKVAVQEAFEVLKLGLVVTGIRLVEWATIANRALHLDFAGAADAVREGNQRVEDQLKASAQRMLDIAAAGQKALVDVWSGKKEAPASKKEKQEFNDPNYDFSKKGSGSGKDDSVMRGLEAELAQRKVTYQEAQRLEGSFREFSKQQELEYWQSKLTTVAAGSKDEVAIKMKIAAEKLVIDKAAFEAQIASIKLSGDEYKKNGEVQIQVAQQVADAMKKAYGEESKEYIDAQRAIVAAQRTANQQRLEIEKLHTEVVKNQALAEIDSERERMQMKLSLGLITVQQGLALERQYAQEKLSIQRQSLQDELAMIDPKKDPVAVAKLNAQLEELELKHQGIMRGFQIKEQTENLKYFSQLGQGMQNSLEGAFKGILTHTTSVGGAIKNMFHSLADTLAGVGAKMAAEWVMNQVKMRLASKETALAELNNSAVAAAGGAYNAVVGIPFIGPVLAPAAAAVAYAGVLAFGSMASAERGYDIPAGVNPVTQLHEREMVLPKEQADAVRQMADGGSGGSIVINTSGGDWIHKKDLATLLKQMNRNFKFA